MLGGEGEFPAFAEVPAAAVGRKRPTPEGRKALGEIPTEVAWQLGTDPDVAGVGWGGFEWLPAAGVEATNGSAGCYGDAGWQPSAAAGCAPVRCELNS